MEPDPTKRPDTTIRSAIATVLRELAMGVVVLGAATWAVAGHYAGPRLDDAREAFARRHASVVFVGNSTTREGIDEAVATETLGAPAVKLYGNGSGTALWWLLLKNVIVHAQPPPRIVCLLYRDHELTNPLLPFAGEPGMELVANSTADEPELDALTFRPGMGMLRHLAYRHWPLWRLRDSAPTLLDRFVRQRLVGPLFGFSGERGDVAYWNVLGDKRMDRARLTAYQFRADDVILTTELDFDGQVERSYLPRMLEVARAHRIELVLVRLRTRHDALGTPMEERNRRYGEETAAWCAQHGVELLDFRGDAALTEPLFGFGDHLTDAGARVFTKRLCERLAPRLTHSE